MKRPERPSGQPTPPPAKPRADTRRTARPVASRTPPPPTPEASGRARRDSRPAVERDAPTTRRDATSAKADRIRKRYERAEVKRFTRHARRRRIGWVAGLATLGIVVALIAVAVFSPILALREIRVDGATRLDPAAIQTALADQLGTPLALLDEGRIRSDLEQFTSIRSYVTELVPPGTLVIHIVERTPLGVVATSSGFDVVDAAGVVLESAPARPSSLPLLQLDAEGVQGPGFAAIVEVLVALPPEVLAQVDSIGARTRDDVTLALAGSDQRVVWGSADDSDRKARIFAALLTRFAAAGPGEYDVSAPGSAVFRLD